MAAAMLLAGAILLSGCGQDYRLAPLASAIPTPVPTPTPWVVEGNSANFDEEVFGSPLPVLVEFYATWCPHCAHMAPAIVQFSVEHAGECKVVQVDVDLEPALTAAYGVTGLPTCIFFVDGVERSRFSGSYATTPENVDLLNGYFDAL
jgi:thioredoxin 1